MGIAAGVADDRNVTDPSDRRRDRDCPDHSREPRLFLQCNVLYCHDGRARTRTPKRRRNRRRFPVGDHNVWLIPGEHRLERLESCRVWQKFEAARGTLPLDGCVIDAHPAIGPVRPTDRHSQARARPLRHAGNASRNPFAYA